MNAISSPVVIASRASKVQKVVAPCGVEAWLVEDYAVSVVACELSFKGGTTQDPDGKGGAATMFSALLDEGAGDLDAEAFHRAMDDKAIELSFSADRDAITGHMRTLARHADAAFGLLGLAVGQARLDDSAVERVRGQLSAGLKREANDPDSVAAKAFRGAAYPGHPYGLPARGDLESVARIERADFLALQRDTLARDNVKIAAVGAISAAQLAHKLEAVFAPLPAQARLRPAAAVAMAGLGTRQIVDLDLPQSTIRFGRPGVSRDDPDFIAAMVVNHVLGGGGFTSRLFQEVREKRGLTYSVYSQMANWDHASLLMGATSTKNERALESLQVIEHEFKRMAEAGPTAEELEKAQKYLTGSYALRFDTSTKIANQLVQVQTEGRDVAYLDERNRLIEAVTLADAKCAAARLLGEGQLLVAVAGRPEGF